MRGARIPIGETPRPALPAGKRQQSVRGPAARRTRHEPGVVPGSWRLVAAAARRDERGACYLLVVAERPVAPSASQITIATISVCSVSTAVLIVMIFAK